MIAQYHGFECGQIWAHGPERSLFEIKALVEIEGGVVVALMQDYGGVVREWAPVTELREQCRSLELLTKEEADALLKQRAQRLWG